MAVIPIKSIFGKVMGLTRPTTAFPKERLVVPGGFVGGAIYLSTTEGSETAVNIQGFTDIENSSTGTAALATRGLTLMSTGASTGYTLAGPPAAGVRKVLMSHSTAAKQVTSSVHIVRGIASSGGGDSGIIAASTAHTVMTLSGTGNVIELVGLSTSAWFCLSAAGFSSASTPLTTV